MIQYDRILNDATTSNCHAARYHLSFASICPSRTNGAPCLWLRSVAHSEPLLILVSWPLAEAVRVKSPARSLFSSSMDLRNGDQNLARYTRVFRPRFPCSACPATLPHYEPYHQPLLTSHTTATLHMREPCLQCASTTTHFL